MSDSRFVDPDAAYAAFHVGAVARLVPRDVVSVTGPDAFTYLQGQCSQDLEQLVDGSAREALLLSPQGKIDAYLRVTRRSADEFVLDGDPGTGEGVIARLERFRLRVQVEIAPLEWVCVAVRGPAASEACSGGELLSLGVDWPGLVGVDLLGPAPHLATSELPWVEPGVLRCDDEVWEAVRIEAGVPVAGHELVEGTIAAEVGLVERAVSFTKGCFTGQELVARLDARGSNVARRLCGLLVGEIEPGRLPPVGATIARAGDDRDSGHLTSVAWSPGFGVPVGLTVLHRRIAPPATVVLRWNDDDGPRETPAEARPLPLVREASRS